MLEFTRTESGTGGRGINSDMLGALVGVLLRQVENFPTDSLLPFVEQFTGVVKLGQHPLQGR